jgi:hypothetical protein
MSEADVAIYFGINGITANGAQLIDNTKVKKQVQH